MWRGQTLRSWGATHLRANGLRLGRERRVVLERGHGLDAALEDDVDDGDKQRRADDHELRETVDRGERWGRGK